MRKTFFLLAAWGLAQARKINTGELAPSRKHPTDIEQASVMNDARHKALTMTALYLDKALNTLEYFERYGEDIEKGENKCPRYIAIYAGRKSDGDDLLRQFNVFNKDQKNLSSTAEWYATNCVGIEPKRFDVYTIRQLVSLYTNHQPSAFKGEMNYNDSR